MAAPPAGKENCPAGTGIAGKKRIGKIVEVAIGNLFQVRLQDRRDLTLRKSAKAGDSWGIRGMVRTRSRRLFLYLLKKTSQINHYHATLPANVKDLF